jgi:hypothetical protein
MCPSFRFGFALPEPKASDMLDTTALVSQGSLVVD